MSSVQPSRLALAAASTSSLLWRGSTPSAVAGVVAFQRRTFRFSSPVNSSLPIPPPEGPKDPSSSTTSSPPSPKKRKKTIETIRNLYRNNKPIATVTAHDYASACWAEANSDNIDVVLVGDSLAMVACGYPSTNQITLQEFLYHCRSVSRGSKTSLLIADMPFTTYESPNLHHGLKNVYKLLQEGGNDNNNIDGIKVEGGKEVVDLVKALTERGVLVMGHVGLLPQKVGALGGYRVQGNTKEKAKKVWEDAKAIADAGAFAIILEAIPSPLAKFITAHLPIPTIGIGAGPHCSGQVLVQLDLLGAFDRKPKFCKEYLGLGKLAKEALGEYGREVKEGVFPEEGKHTYPMKFGEGESWEEIEDFLKS